MAADTQLRVFLDANVFIRGITLPRFPYEVLRHAANGEFVLVTSPLVLDSVRLYVGTLFPDYRETFEVLLAVLHYELVPDASPEAVKAHADLVRDPKDVPVALAAIQAGVDYLVSTDQDFTDVDDSTAELRTQLRPIRVGSFLHDGMGGRRPCHSPRTFWPEWRLLWPPAWRSQPLAGCGMG
jgi:predicted nucleic acid-binding protein